MNECPPSFHSVKELNYKTYFPFNAYIAEIYIVQNIRLELHVRICELRFGACFVDETAKVISFTFEMLLRDDLQFLRAKLDEDLNPDFVVDGIRVKLGVNDFFL